MIDLEPALFSRLLGTVAAHLGGARVLSILDDAELAGHLVGSLPVTAMPTLIRALKESDSFPEVSFVLPPWGSRPDRRWEVEHPPAKPFGLIVPAGELRMSLPGRLINLGEPTIVVEGSLPAAGGFRRPLAVALVVVDPSPPEGALVTRFFRAPSGLGIEAACAELSDLLSRAGGRTENGFVHRSESLSRESLRYEDHDPRVAAEEDDLSDFGEGGTVGDIFDVLIPRPPMRRPGIEIEELDETVRVIRARDLSLAGELLPIDVDVDEARRPPRIGVELQPGDFVMREIERPDRRGKPVEIEEADLPAAAGLNLIVLRPKALLEPEVSEFYRLYLASERSRVVMRPSRMGDHVRLVGIRRCPLPVPDADLVDALRSIRRAQGALKEWTDEGVGLTSRAFEGSAGDARRTLIETGRELRLRVEAAAQIGSLDHRIANFYPYPIAHKWRLVRVAESAGDASRTYGAILECFEATVVFGAALALACAHVNRLEVGAMAEVRKKLTHGGGLSVGDWVNILKIVASSKPFKRLNPDAPLAVVRELLPEGSVVARAQERLSERRNSESHQRKVDELDLRGAVEEARTDLELILSNAGFLADLPVYQVRSIRWDSFEGVGQAVVEVLRGDHPVPTPDTITHKQMDLEKDSLYVRDLSGDLILLRPFLMRLQCPRCRSWSTFHPDRRHHGQLELKAVDHAHSIDGSPYERVLARVGYLEPEVPAVERPGGRG
ncbi:hypothetical protein IEQ44_05515 [Nocardioides sp. Y6]|uniref:Restriction endonuclease n=1 Tax=Nocardioides malaquae TaxID=2773426 RepID=A0ABR9RRB1_9ACTN|nr:hypothetical protein [Nocardioides malaquae]MBE7324103.1 hypothetical protein [Nocardioides malaquae]